MWDAEQQGLVWHGDAEQQGLVWHVHGTRLDVEQQGLGCQHALSIIW